jgi:hypothetical protein
MSALAVAIRIVADRVGGRTAVWPGTPLAPPAVLDSLVVPS